MKQVKVLFVCMGNICRSPTAHGVFEKVVLDAGLSEQIGTDSAGTHAYHVGEPPDTRSQATARQHGVDLSHQRARRVQASDFSEFDYVLAMDEDNYQILYSQCPAEYRQRVRLFMQYAAERTEREVPDPYYGGGNGFERVFDMVEAAASGLLAEIRKQAHY
ncbi:MAG: low molecular weight phosphotyrosine protein phosphatase [gamma proteobacterium symbiont of Bathyaustriella thionipta]|nr:low molecular weight phosphotyrosine protein phosphatase [gamma proteobacterium symbiont of Bathyaustriella thionipta]